MLWKFDRNYPTNVNGQSTFCSIDLYRVDGGFYKTSVILYDNIDHNNGLFVDIAHSIKICHASSGIVLPNKVYDFAKDTIHLYRNNRNPEFREFE